MPKVALITGCSSGFGYTTARLFAQKGLITYASARSLTNSGFAALKKLNLSNLHLLQLDITSDPSVKTAVDIILKEQGRLDILINNAGFGFLGPVEAFTLDEIKQQYNTNLFGVLRLIKAITSTMRAQRSGLIINVSSVNGLVSFPLYGVYSSSKFALETLSEVLRFELQPFGIKIVLVEPGSFNTAFSKNRRFPQSIPEVYRKWHQHFFHLLDHQAARSEHSFINRFLNPQIVASKLFDIVNTSNPKLRYRLGFDTHFFYWSRRLIPYSWWSKAINWGYHWLE